MRRSSAPRISLSAAAVCTRSRTVKLYAAAQPQAPVAPAVIFNAEPVFTRENYLSLAPCAQVVVRFGRSLAPPAGSDGLQTLRTFIRQIIQDMAELLPEELQVERQRREQAEQQRVQQTGPQPGDYPDAPVEDM